ncbi:uroporphyrinogen III methylase HemX [Legionella adelaidensis]|uniref:Uroporphyrinogen III methylase HemX n=1 Tax=Legionella adelaidensis TaxID=45056 RepID=A0A0W0R629_9GAMM|nr:uroporphyrinogen-III C-methyltransferase [Legionella adelaidensis]KTC66490.1 uroporphyrinogen III methylase HemX [Legionella adelaidensis]
MANRKPEEKNVEKTEDTVLITNPPTIIKPSKTPFYISIILGLLALLLSGYAIYAYFIMQKQKNIEISQLKTELTIREKEQIALTSQIESTTKLINQSQNTLEEKVQGSLNQFQENLQKIVQQTQYKEQDWLLLQARYYLELAQMNAQWNNNAASTLALLKQADAVLSGLNEQRLFPVRQAIAKEIAQVEATPKVDLPGILSQLDASQDLIQSLPVKKPEKAESSAPIQSSSTNGSKWSVQWHKSLEMLSKLVVIRRNDTPYQPLVSPKEEGIARNILRLNIQEVQWAALQGNNQLYQFALKQALKNTALIFDINNAKTQLLINKLESLQQIQITQPRIMLNESLPLLNNLLGTMEKSS